MGQFGKSLLAVTALASVALAIATTTQARDRYADEEPGVYRYVYAEETFGGSRVSAPVREGEFGDQVRVPGGNWVNCEVSCEYTLRRLTVDFWDGQTNKYVSPSYFRKEFELPY